jgi:hypothetical protein
MKQNIAYGVIFIAVSFVTSIPAAQAQTECNAEGGFSEVTCQQSGTKCVSIKINTDPSGRMFTYNWSLGDGTYQQGTEIQHCYAEFGFYHISLQLIDVESGIRIDDEITKDLLVGPSPAIVATEKIFEGSVDLYSFSFDLDGFSVQNVFWNFDNKEFLCGSKAGHAFKSPGPHEINLLVEGYYKGKYTSVCSTLPVQVKEHNLERLPFQSMFEEKEKKLPTNGRYLDDIIHVVLLDKRGTEPPLIIDLDSLDQHIEIKPDKEYTAFAWKSNMFTHPVDFSSGSEENVDLNWKQALSSLLSQVPDHFDPFFFELDAMTAKSESLARNVMLLKNYPWLRVGIGIYTHTGGRQGINKIVSKKRASWLLDYLQQQGIEQSRIEIMTLLDDARLLNTCNGLENCPSEDAALNGKAEFKVRIKN